MISNILVIFATIILFLFSVSKFSKNIERVAGEKVKLYLSKITETRLRSTFMGFIANAIVQSNSALTVTLVGLVNAGLITFRGSLGVIIGSNVGNTLTSQMLAFNVIGLAPLFIVIGFMMRRFHSPIKHYSGPVFYFGLMFLSLSYMQLLINPYIESPEMIKLISTVSNIHIAIIVGIIISLIFQSSTVTSILAITLATQGLLNFDQAFGIIMGSGIGTTATAVIASIVMNTAAQRTALSHLLFNVVGVILTVSFHTPIKKALEYLSSDIGQTLANAHVLMSIITAVLLLMIFNLYAKLVEKIIPDKGLFHKTRNVIENKI